MIEYLGALSLLALCFAALGAWISRRLGKIADGYLSEKAKNIATKEDIADITRSVEEVKNEYNLLLEEIRSRNSLKMAALDKRLEVHQEAIDLCVKAARKVFRVEELVPFLATMDEFYFKNCIYLTTRSRVAFMASYRSVGDYATFNRAALESNDENMKAEAKKMWSEIMSAPNIIMKELELPPLTESEIQSER